MKRIVVTGAGGAIAYSLIFRIAQGELLGAGEPLSLHLLETPAAFPSLEGVLMELADCAFPLLKEVKAFSDPHKAFEGAHYAFLVGAKPRGPGMERRDLLLENGSIFVEQGRALDAVADRNVRVLVVGNPCNTNCLIAIHHAPSLNPSHFAAMTRLDENRARSALAAKAGRGVSEVSRLVIWGNHSSTQVPDYFHARVGEKRALEAVPDRSWFEGAFVQKVQKRGAEVIAARGGKSSAASAAHAALYAMRALLEPTAPGDWFSSALFSNGNPYGIAKDLVFSFPCVSQGRGDAAIVEGLDLPPELLEKIRISEKELIDERSLVAHLLNR